MKQCSASLQVLNLLQSFILDTCYSLFFGGCPVHLTTRPACILCCLPVSHFLNVCLSAVLGILSYTLHDAKIPSERYHSVVQLKVFDMAFRHSNWPC